MSLSLKNQIQIFNLNRSISIILKHSYPDQIFICIPQIRKLYKIVNDGLIKMEKTMNENELFQIITNVFNQTEYWLSELDWLIEYMAPLTKSVRVHGEIVEVLVCNFKRINSWYKLHKQITLFKKKYEKYFIRIINKIFIQLPTEVINIIGSYLV